MYTVVVFYKDDEPKCKDCHTIEKAYQAAKALDSKFPDNEHTWEIHKGDEHGQLVAFSVRPGVNFAIDPGYISRPELLN